MDEMEKAALDAVAKAAVAPVTNVVADILGVLGADQLADYRERKRRARTAEQARVAEEAVKLLKNRGVEPDPDVPHELLEQVAEAAQDNSIEELRNLYARLVAAIADSKRRPHFRKEFIAIAKALEPVDVLVLPELQMGSEAHPTRAQFIANRIQASDDQVLLSFRNLLQLGLTEEPPNRNWTSKPILTPLGRQFLRAVAD